MSSPISRFLSWTIIHLGLALLLSSSDLPSITTGHCMDALFDLAPSGVCPAKTVASFAVRSYRTFSPLPQKRRFVFCDTFHRLTPSGRYPALCPVETGLSSVIQRLSSKLARYCSSLFYQCKRASLIWQNNA